MGASILPVTIHNNKIMFLFGKERTIDENPGWSDFGGGTDKGESYLQTAVREGGEELTGFLGSDSEVRDMLTKYGTHNIDYKSENYNTYRCHIFPMKYDEMLPKYYNNNQQFLQKRLDPKIIKNTKIFEKTQIKWFTFDEMIKKQNNFRSFYRNIIYLIVGNKSGIEGFVKKALQKTQPKTKTRRTFRNKKANTKSKK